jgi:hypothetical protein
LSVYSAIEAASFWFAAPEKNSTLALLKYWPSAICVWRTAHSRKISPKRSPVVTGLAVTLAARRTASCACRRSQPPPLPSLATPRPIASAFPSHCRASFSAVVRLPSVPSRRTVRRSPRNGAVKVKSWLLAPRLMLITFFMIFP